jgi:hypothetical protein
VKHLLSVALHCVGGDGNDGSGVVECLPLADVLSGLRAAQRSVSDAHVGSICRAHYSACSESGRERMFSRKHARCEGAPGERRYLPPVHDGHIAVL